MTSPIEAGARIIDPDAWLLYDNANKITKMQKPVSLWRVEPSLAKAKACIEAAIASGELVPAAQLAADHLDHLEGGLQLLLAAAKACDPHKEIAWRAEEELRQVARLRALSPEPASGEWRDISTARKDRTPILAKFFDDIYPRIEPQRSDLESWNGLQVVIRHPGIPDSGFDIGWSVAAPVGNGGLPDRWIEGWMALPTKDGELA